MQNPKPRKRFGQHFLHDQRVLEQIVAALPRRADRRLIEIGPGRGALTGHLVHTFGDLTVIEIDRDLVEILRTRFAGVSGLEIKNADALAFDFGLLVTPPSKMTLVGNLPYNISTPLLFHLFKFQASIDEMIFMLQKEVVERLVAQPGSKQFGRLSVMAQYRCRIEQLFTVLPGSFIPPPKVKSAVVRLVPHQQPPAEIGDETTFSNLVLKAFNQRRKTLRNALKELLSEEEILACGVDPKARAENLGVSEFAALSRLRWSILSKRNAVQP